MGMGEVVLLVTMNQNASELFDFFGDCAVVLEVKDLEILFE
jgi:hypothetical protein